MLNKTDIHASPNFDLPVREILSRRTEYSTVFSLGNGRYQAILCGEPIHEWNEETQTFVQIDRRTDDPASFLTWTDETGISKRLKLDESTLADAHLSSTDTRKKSPATLEEYFTELDERLHPEWFIENYRPGVHLRLIRGRKLTVTAEYQTAKAAKDGLVLDVESDSPSSSPQKETIQLTATPAEYAEDDSAGTGGTTASRDDADSSPDQDTAPFATASLSLGNTRDSSTLTDTYVQESSTTDYSSNARLYVRLSASGAKGQKAFLRFLQLPALGSSDFLTQAVVRLKPILSLTSDTCLNCREVTGSWVASSVTYANQPQQNSLFQDYTLVKKNSYAWVGVDVTSLARQWYLGNNYGFALEGPFDTARQMAFSSSDGSYSPYLVVTYASLAGLENYFTYDNQNVGRAGTGSVNLANGNLVYAHSDTQMNGLRMPVSVTHYYNACDAASNPFGLGYGWRTNLHQTLSLTITDGVSEYIYTDSDGTRHHFLANNSGVYEDQSGLGLKLTFDTTLGTATVTDKGDDTLTFPNPTDGSTTKLQSIADAVGNTATLTWSNDLLTAATDGSGRVTSFAYTNGLLSSITAPYGTVSFAYTSGNLTSVTYEDSLTSVFTYSGNHLLVSAENPGGIKAEYTYASTGAIGGLPAVVLGAQVSGGSGSSALVQSDAAYAYGSHVTRVTDNLSSKTLRYHFNDNGNCISVDDELGYAVYTRYDQTDNNASAPINHATLRSRMQRVVTNLLVDGSQEKNSSLWTTATEAGSCSFIREADIYQWGLCSRRIRISNAAGKGSCTQSVALTAAEGYTLSCYVRSDAPTAYIRVKYTVNQVETVLTSQPVAPVGDQAFHRISLSFTLPESASAITVACAMVAEAPTGDAWFDCMQLERGLTCNSYNLIENSDFAKGTGVLPDNWTNASAWDSGFGVVALSDVGAPSFLTGRALRIEGKYNRTMLIQQTIRAYGNAGDRLTLGGWCQSFTKANDASGSIRCRMTVTNGANGNVVGSVEWNPEEGEWQFGSGSVVMPTNYSELCVKLHLNRQMNHACFAGLYLYAEQFGTEYTYDANGNRVATRQLYGNGGSSQYDSHDNLTSYTAPGRTLATSYNYGTTDAEQKQHLLLSMTRPLGTRASYLYNAYGHPTQAKVDDSTGSVANFIQTTTAYTTSGNYANTQTDARGETVSTVTDEDTGTVTSVTDPRNQTVAYTYDSLRRPTKTGTMLTATTEVKSESMYHSTLDVLSSVKHNTTASASGDVTYSFGHDSLGRKTVISVGNQILSTTTYDTIHREVETVTFANGGVERYLRDDFGRLTGIRYDGATSNRYSYGYDAQGRVAYVVDHVRGVTVRTAYDLAGRPCEKTHLTAATHLYTGSLTYNLFNLPHAFTEYVGATRTSYTTGFGYDAENRVTALVYGTGSMGYTYDKLGRIAKRTLTPAATDIDTTYTYLPGGQGTNSTTGLIQNITQGGVTLTYTYDACGNIAQVETGTLLTGYTYDAIGRLTRVDDQTDTTADTTGTTWVFTYDLGGNILTKKAYAYTTGSVSGLTPTESPSYTYGATTINGISYGRNDWLDMLAAHDGVGISYDAIGNPTNDGTWTYTWQHGRQLQQMSKAGETVSFEYNEDGLRTKKTATSTGATEYILHGKNIVHLTNGTNNLHFYYDAQGRPTIVIYNGTAYGYLYNLQGDVVAIIDGAGTKVVEYKYDAWGKPTSKTGTLASTLGTVQPFRYRGYVFDEETGDYYLRSRYYRPEWGRFVSADALVKDNLYAYCFNNFINYYDKSGFDWTYSLNETTKLHDVVIELVCMEVGGFSARSITKIMGAGRGGGYGFPDVVDMERRTWEIKFNNTSYGYISGSLQMKRYTNNTGYRPGYPVYIPSFEYVLDGIPGLVEITNGSIETNDIGVVYYSFYPYMDLEKEYSIAREPVLEQSQVTALDMVVGVAMLLAAILSPIPGDEVAAAIAFVELLH